MAVLVDVYGLSDDPVVIRENDSDRTSELLRLEDKHGNLITSFGTEFSMGDLSLASDASIIWGGDTILHRSDIATLKLEGAFRTSDEIVAIDGGVGNQTALGGNGIEFGGSRDTNLYRSAANKLKTDDKFLIGIASSASDQLQLTDTGAGTGILFGGDTTFYRASASNLKTDGNLVATGTVTGSNIPGSFYAVPGYGTSLPGSPANGDEYILVDSTSAPTYQWRFRYNSTEAKWGFIGGAPVMVSVATSENPGSTNAWVNLTTDGPLFTVPRAGDYQVSYSTQVYFTLTDPVGGRTGTVQVGISIGNTTPGKIEYQSQWDPEAGTNMTKRDTLSGSLVKTGLSANDVIKLRYDSPSSFTTSEVAFANRIITVTPVKVT